MLLVHKIQVVGFPAFQCDDDRPKRLRPPLPGAVDSGLQDQVCECMAWWSFGGSCTSSGCGRWKLGGDLDTSSRGDQSTFVRWIPSYAGPGHGWTGHGAAPFHERGFWLGALVVGSDGSRTKRQEGLLAQCKGHNVVVPGKVRRWNFSQRNFGRSCVTLEIGDTLLQGRFGWSTESPRTDACWRSNWCLQPGRHSVWIFPQGSGSSEACACRACAVHKWWRRCQGGAGAGPRWFGGHSRHRFEFRWRRSIHWQVLPEGRGTQSSRWVHTVPALKNSNAPLDVSGSHKGISVWSHGGGKTCCLPGRHDPLGHALLWKVLESGWPNFGPSPCVGWPDQHAVGNIDHRWTWVVIKSIKREPWVSGSCRLETTSCHKQCFTSVNTVVFGTVQCETVNFVFSSWTWLQLFEFSVWTFACFDTEFQFSITFSTGVQGVWMICWQMRLMMWNSST